MKRRVNIGAALLHKPRFLYLDEPTVGIDPQSRRSILDGVKDLNASGVTVLYTTHYMEEAQELSHRIGIMDKGKMIAVGTQDELVRLVGERTRIDLALDREAESLAEQWRELPGVSTVSEPENERMWLGVEDANTLMPQLFDTARAAGARITEISLAEPNLEMVFLHLTGRGSERLEARQGPGEDRAGPQHRLERPAPHLPQPGRPGHDAGRAPAAGLRARAWPSAPVTTSPSRRSRPSWSTRTRAPGRACPPPARRSPAC